MNTGAVKLADEVLAILVRVAALLKDEVGHALDGNIPSFTEPGVLLEEARSQLSSVERYIERYDADDLDFVAQLQQEVDGLDSNRYAAEVSVALASRYPEIHWLVGSEAVRRVKQDLYNGERRANRGLPERNLYLDSRDKTERLARLIRVTWHEDDRRPYSESDLGPQESELMRKNDQTIDEEPVEGDEERNSTGFKIRDIVPDGLEFGVLPDPDTMLDVRGLLEQLVGLTTELIQQGKFEHDPMLEDRIGRDRDSLRYELFENPDIDSTMIAIVTQRTLSAIIPVLDDGEQKDLLRAIAGTPDRNPQSVEAAEAAVDKAQQVADALEDRLDHAEVLAESLEELLNTPVEAGTTGSTWMAGALRWGPPAVEGLALGATVTGTAQALGATGPTSIVLGAILGLLALFRPRNKQP